MPFLEVTLSFLGGRLLPGSFGLCFALCRVRVLLPFISLCGGEVKKQRVGSSFSFERGRREVLVLGCVWWLVSMAEQSCRGPGRCSNPTTGPILWSCLSWSCRSPNPTDESLSWAVRVEVPIQPTEVLSCMVCGPESGFCVPLVVWSSDQSCMVFGSGFPYKLGQLPSS
jgi:hypothetical protein